jgi:hypothetical protein
MITPSFGLTATERVLPRLALDWTTGLAQSGVDVTRAGVATFVGSNGLIQSSTADTQRIDYVTGTAGLLVEESRTNINTYSAGSFVNGSNGYVNSGTLVTTVAGIDGTANAQQFTFGSGSAQNVYKTIAVSASTAYTFSFYYQLGTYPESEFQIAFRDDTNGAFISFDIVPTKTPLSNGWVRATHTVTTPVGCLLLRCYMLRFTPVTGGTIAFDGVQLEAGAFPTSYIPTEATAATRNADVATMTGTNFTSWVNTVEGTIQAKGQRYVSNTEASAFCLVAAGTNIVRIGTAFEVFTAGSAVALFYGTAASTFNSVGAYKQDSFAYGKNGVLVGTDSLGNVPTMTSARFDSGVGTFLNGWVQKINYWPQRLTNAEVTAFSKL